MKNLEMITSYKGFNLFKEDNFYFITGISENYLDISGEKEELIAELKRWRNEIDFDNAHMLDIETFFINILENR